MSIRLTMNPEDTMVIAQPELSDESATVLEPADAARTESADAPLDAAAFEGQFELAVRAYQSADYERAVLHFNAARRFHPASFALYAYRGDALRLLGEYDA